MSRGGGAERTWQGCALPPWDVLGLAVVRFVQGRCSPRHQEGRGVGGCRGESWSWVSLGLLATPVPQRRSPWGFQAAGDRLILV